MADMPTIDPVTLLSAAIDELLIKNAHRIEGDQIDELVELIVECALGLECDQATANLRGLNEWLSRFALRLRVRHHRDTEDKLVLLNGRSDFLAARKTRSRSAPKRGDRTIVGDDGTTIWLTSYNGFDRIATVELLPTRAVALAVDLIRAASPKLRR
jgi:hypothetical protein